MVINSSDRVQLLEVYESYQRLQSMEMKVYFQLIVLVTIVTEEVKSYQFGPTKGNKLSCDSKWLKVLEGDKNGKVVSGSKEDLRHAVVSGSKIRIILDELYSTDTQNVYSLNGEICAQALFHISKGGFDSHQTKAYWWFLNVCTTGNVHMSRWYVGVHQSPSESKVKYNIKWFARHLGCDSTLAKPVLCTTESGFPYCGNVNNLINVIRHGAEIHGVDARRNGSRDISRWSIGEHKDRGHTTDKLPMIWLADTCWSLAYEHDEHGESIDGSLDYLRSAILNGKRVRLHYHSGYLIEADELIIRNGHVTAQVLGHVSNSGKTFHSDAYWYWENVATTGAVETVRYNIGSHTSRGKTNYRQRIKWFIDTRPWKHVFSNSASGKSIHGSKTTLIQEVKAGKMVRFTVKSASHPQSHHVSVLNADNIGINKDEKDVGAQHIRSIGYKKNGPFNVSFTSNPYWNFLIASTTGKIDESKWTVGIHETQGRKISKAAIDWFVS
ncbi:unnamed protein product [Mytilus edulis]|uniref:Uncharacterized protein n=1 Tax=Mytilus edulis TaxID=6550 RepID=A0A8S3PP67_MYTED|nr:unnamed protein product [Mytilus edulis]